nr:uncharacterized protein LOC110567469 [Aotus nancymaae]
MKIPLQSAGMRNLLAQRSSLHRPIQLCIRQSCFIRFQCMYIANKEICSRLVCKEHEAMKGELCHQMVGLPLGDSVAPITSYLIPVKMWIRRNPMVCDHQKRGKKKKYVGERKENFLLL